MNKLFYATSMVALATLSACGPMPPFPPLAVYENMDKFMSDLAARANAQLGGASDFKVVVTQANFPIGTLLRPESTIPIEYTACLPSTKPPTAETPSLFPTYKLSSGLAIEFGLDNDAVRKLADFGVKIKDTDIINVSVKDPKIQSLSDNEIKEIINNAACRSSLPEGGAWLIRGYIAGQRNFSLKNETTNNIKGKVDKVASFDVGFGSGDASLDMSDTAKTEFLQLVSQVSISTPNSTANNIALTVDAPRSTSKPGRVYVQRDRQDTSSNGEAIVASLKSQSFLVAAGIERVDTSRMPKTAQVRYFNDSDKSSAERALFELKKLFPTATVLRVGLPAPSGQLEVWLPRI